MLPTQQGFKSANSIGREVENGLIKKAKLILGERLSQVRLQQTAGLQLRIHLCLEESPDPALIRLGAVKRQISILEQFLARCAICRGHGDTYTYTNREACAVDLVWGADDFDAMRRARSVVSIGLFKVPLHNGEFVSAESSDGVYLANTSQQSIRHLPQQ